ncbi:hypothetical protein [Streptomyces sp. NPDC058572]
MPPNVPRTPPRRIRIGDEWYEFDAAADIMLPARPDVEAWQTSGEPTT